MKAYVLAVISLAATLFCIRCWTLWRRWVSRAIPYPPGPKGLPIIGNILDMPGRNEWETARQWGTQYGELARVFKPFPPRTHAESLGDLVSVKNFGTRFLFVNSYEAAADLLEKRGNIYSTRPSVTMVDL